MYVYIHVGKLIYGAEVQLTEYLCIHLYQYTENAYINVCLYVSINKK
jgi:hypothetical protein